MKNSPDFLKPLFLLNPEIHFLNHGSFGATPQPVFESYQRWQRELEFQPVEFLGRRAADLLASSRTVLAQYLGTQRDNLVYVTNATFGLNIVARSLDLGPGDEVLTTNHEYGALDRTWKFLAKKQGFSYTSCTIPTPLSERGDFVEALWSAVTPHTRVIFLSHITSPTALIFPVEEICRRARQNGILTVVDGAHAPGQIPLNLEEIGADFYSGNLHKWLCAPKGAAFLYARPEVQNLIEPLIVSWGWQAEIPGPSQFVDYLEWEGTRDISAFLTVPDAIQFQQDYHWDEVRARCHQLASVTYDQINVLTGLQGLSSNSPLWFNQMCAAPVPDSVDLNKLKTRLYDEFCVEIPVIDWNNHKFVRFSFQGYNTEQDSQALLFALEKLL